MSWLNELFSNPMARMLLMLAATACAWELMRYMKARDAKKLQSLREDRERRGGERIAAIAERVRNLGGSSGAAQQGVSDDGFNSGQIGRGGNGPKS